MSYQLSVLVNQARVIVSWDLDPSQEASRVPNLLDQAGSLGTVETALFDAGYHTDGVMTATTERGIELRCPSGRTLPDGDRTRPDDQSYSKQHFTDDAASDGTAARLARRSWPASGAKATLLTEGYTRYRTRACVMCEQRSPCTTSKQGRTLKRYRSDDAKATLRQTMAVPANQQRYRQRQAMVEPLFSVLRLQQGLNRFRRRGLRRVRSEFAWHVMTYNLGRAIALRPAGASFATLWHWIEHFRRWLYGRLARADCRLPSSAPHPCDTLSVGEGLGRG